MRGAFNKLTAGGAEAVQFPLRAGGMPHAFRQQPYRARGGERRARGAMPVACDPAGMAPMLFCGSRRVALPGVAPFVTLPPVRLAVPPVFALVEYTQPGRSALASTRNATASADLSVSRGGGR